MKLRSFRKREEGAVTIIVALGITVLFGFTALALDYGIMAITRQSLQNAVDAAALAAARDRGDQKSQAAIVDTIREYCAANHVDPEDDGVSLDYKIPPTTSTVTVTLSKQVQMGFSSVLTGERVRTVSASATAEAVGLFASCPYALFAGKHIDDGGDGISINGNSIEINGDIHSNSDISMKHATLGKGVTATAVNRSEPSTAGWNSNSIARDMPSGRSICSALEDTGKMIELNSQTSDDLQSLISSAKQKYVSLNGNKDYLEEGLIIHVSGNLIFKNNKKETFSADCPVTLIVDGAITLNGTALVSDYDYPMIIISKESSITVNGGGSDYTGILYAPKGDVILNGNGGLGATFVGSVIAENITKNGGKTTVSYMDNLDRFLPKAKVHLIA